MPLVYLTLSKNVMFRVLLVQQHNLCVCFVFQQHLFSTIQSMVRLLFFLLFHALLMVLQNTIGVVTHSLLSSLWSAPAVRYQIVKSTYDSGFSLFLVISWIYKISSSLVILNLSEVASSKDYQFCEMCQFHLVTQYQINDSILNYRMSILSIGHLHVGRSYEF